jgi:hypothetical protein
MSTVDMDTAVERQKMKDAVLKALQKLNDKDTVQTGAEEMKEIVQVRVRLGRGWRPSTRSASPLELRCCACCDHLFVIVLQLL